MDNVSEWWPGFTRKEYRQYWERTFGISKQDQEYFDQYAELRFNHYHDDSQTVSNYSANINGIFTDSGSESIDPIAHAFYSSEKLNEAYLKLAAIISEKELEFLKDYYQYFASKYEPMIVQSQFSYQHNIEVLQAFFEQPEVFQYLSQTAQFYQVDRFEFNVLFVWWPPLDRTNATTSGKHIIMRYSPELHRDVDATEVVVHEIIHMISARQKSEQK